MCATAACTYAQYLAPGAAPGRPRSPKNNYKYLLKVRQNGPNADRRYSADSKTDEPIKIYWKISFFPDLEFFGPNWGNKPPLEHIFRTCVASLCALVWCAHDEFMRAHTCIVCVFQSAWFGTHTKVFAVVLERAKHGKLSGARAKTEWVT